MRASGGYNAGATGSTDQTRIRRSTTGANGVHRVVQLATQVVVRLKRNGDFIGANVQVVERVLVDWLHIVEVWVGANFLFGHDRSGNFTLLRTLGARYGFRAEKIDPVRYKDFVADPIGTIRGYYEFTGRRLTPQAEAAMRGILESTPRSTEAGASLLLVAQAWADAREPAKAQQFPAMLAAVAQTGAEIDQARAPCRAILAPRNHGVPAAEVAAAAGHPTSTTRNPDGFLRVAASTASRRRPGLRGG